MGFPFVLLLGFAPLQKCTYHGKGLCITHTHEICLFLGNPLDRLYVIYSVWFVVWSWIPGGGGRKKKKSGVMFSYFFRAPPLPGTRTKQALHRNGLCVRGNG